jgi:hypothetical protein
MERAPFPKPREFPMPVHHSFCHPLRRFASSIARNSCRYGIVLLAMSSGVLAQENTRNGIVMGGVAGAVIGGVVGNNHKDQAAEGALIGGAVGAVAGGLMGRQRDQTIAQQSHSYPMRSYPYGYRPQGRTRYPGPIRTDAYGVPVLPQYANGGPYGYPPSTWGQPTIIQHAPVVSRRGVYQPPMRAQPHVVRNPVTLDDVLHMTRSGVSDTVIASHIQTQGVMTRPSVDDVVALSQAGVSDFVITVLQNAGNADAGMPAGMPASIVPIEPQNPQRERRGF